MLLTPAELTRDTRARRAAAAATELGFGVVGVCGRISGETPVPLDDVVIVRAGRAGRTHRQWTLGTEPKRESGAKRELRGFFRLARYAVRTARLVRAARTFGGTNIVHAHDLDALAAGYVLARQARARLVYDAHELYSDFEPFPPRAARAVLLRLERTVARRADAVVTVSDAIADELRRRFGVDPIVVLNAPPLDAREPPEPPADPLRVVYQGAFGPGRPLEDLLAGIAETRNVRLTLRVSRTPASDLRAAIPEAMRERVVPADPVPPARVIDGLHGHHAGLLFDRPLTRNAELSSPNKLFEYLMAGLAVVVPRLPGMTPLVEGERVGLTYEPGRPDLLAEALTRLDADRNELTSFRKRARTLALDRLNAVAAAEVLASAWVG